MVGVAVVLDRDLAIGVREVDACDQVVRRRRGPRTEVSGVGKPSRSSSASSLSSRLALGERAFGEVERHGASELAGCRGVPRRAESPERLTRARASMSELRRSAFSIARSSDGQVARPMHRSNRVRGTLVVGMPSTTSRSSVLERERLVDEEAVVASAAPPWTRDLDDVAVERPGSSQSSAAVRCDATARVPPAQHAASTCPSPVEWSPDDPIDAVVDGSQRP